MSKTVLLIESDSSFARDMSAALESRGFGVRTSSEGKEGVELARALRPDCVVLCVELPGLSGYSWCNRLKKDDALKSIPLVITSSEATPETFEQHRKLKTRAEDYLIKPFLPGHAGRAGRRARGNAGGAGRGGGARHARRRRARRPGDARRGGRRPPDAGRGVRQHLRRWRRGRAQHPRPRLPRLRAAAHAPAGRRRIPRHASTSIGRWPRRWRRWPRRPRLRPRPLRSPRLPHPRRSGSSSRPSSPQTRRRPRSCWRTSRSSRPST